MVNSPAVHGQVWRRAHCTFPLLSNRLHRHYIFVMSEKGASEVKDLLPHVQNTRPASWGADSRARRVCVYNEVEKLPHLVDIVTVGTFTLQLINEMRTK